MIDQNVSSFKQQVLDARYIQSANTINRSSRSIIPLATVAFCLLNLHQSALAVDIKTQVAVNQPHFLDSGSAEHHDRSEEREHNHSPKLLSRLLNLIIYPFTDRSSALPEADAPAKNFYFNGMGGSFNQNLAPLYLSQAESASDKEFFLPTTIPSIEPISLASSTTNPNRKTYAVKPGDTLDRIADQHQVSRQELISLNQIEDSNVIFADRILKIPAANLDDTQSQKLLITQTNLPQSSDSASNSSSITNHLAQAKSNSKSSSKLEPTSNSPDDLQAERLANLRADISRLRTEIERENDNDFDGAEVSVISSLNSDSDRSSDLMTEETISLTLPPLPSSEEYLPEAFDGYSWPAQGVLSSGYGWRWGRLHKGIDIAAPVGTPIFAAASGEVISAGWNSGGYGNLVKLQHLDGSITLYAHNNRILVSNGQRVNRGQQIAEMGNTGFSTGSHLHFEIHSRNRGVVNPLALLGKN